jgi:Alginate export
VTSEISENFLNQWSRSVIKPFLRRSISVLGFSAVLILASQASAQQSATQYIEYPQTRGVQRDFKLGWIPKWATLDIQLRGRTEYQSSDNYISGNGQTYELTRVYGGLEVRPTKFLTGYIQFIDTHALGLPLKYVAANQRDVFDDRQAYLEFHTKEVKIFAGRQELKYGSERLVGISDWTNNSRTWDGFLARIGDKNRLDLFSTSVVAVHPSSLDKHGAGLTFHGAVGTIGTWIPHMVVQPFVYFKSFPGETSQQAIKGSDLFVTPGAEVAGQFPIGLDFDAMGALQRGNYSNDTVKGAAGYVKAGWNFKSLTWKPRLRGEYDYASGNDRKDLYRIGTFDQQYPSNHNAFGLTDLFGFQNIKQERMNLDLIPSQRLSLLFQQEWLQMATPFDNIYSGSAGTVVKAPTTGLLSSDIGREFDASGKYLISDSLVMNAGVGHFSPGTVMRENTHGAPLTIAYFSLTYRFKVDHKGTTATPAP